MRLQSHSIKLVLYFPVLFVQCLSVLSGPPFSITAFLVDPLAAKMHTMLCIPKTTTTIQITVKVLHQVKTAKTIERKLLNRWEDQ